MDIMKLLEIATGVSTIISLTAFFAVLYFWYSHKSKAKSVYSLIRGEDVADPESVVSILEAFDGDEQRIIALQEILKGDRVKSKHLLDKVSAEIDLESFTNTQLKKQIISMSIFGLIFLLLAVIAAYSTSHSDDVRLDWDVIKNAKQNNLLPGDKIEEIKLSMSEESNMGKIKYEKEFVGCDWLILDGDVVKGEIPYDYDKIRKPCDIRVVAVSEINEKTYKSPPLSISVSTKQFAVDDVSVGTHHVCVLLIGGSVNCFGGMGGSYDSILAPKGIRAKAITSGYYHACAVLANGGITCWGDVAPGKVQPPVEAQAFEAKRIIAGYRKTCIQPRSGNLVCWGGDDDNLWQVPEIARNGSVLKSLSGDYICSLNEQDLTCLIDGKVKGIWSKDEVGVTQFSEPTTERVCAVESTSSIKCYLFASGEKIDITDEFDEPVIQLVDTGLYLCALINNGGVQCKLPKQLSTKLIHESIKPTPPAGLRAVKLFAGKHYSVCALSIDGRVKCWNYGGGKEIPNRLPEEVPSWLS